MRHCNTRAFFLVALAVQLGGCHSFLGIKSARNVSAKPAAETAFASQLPEPTLATETGRSELAAGLTGSAIESFQRALATGEPTAPAVNGLGVAYARLGRYDLAERFFEQAMAADPAEPRYAANLARMLRLPDQAARRYGDIAAASITTAERSAAAPPTGAPPGRLQRVSRSEVRIATAPPQPAPVPSVAANLHQRFEPLVRISFADSPKPRGRSFVRVELPEPQPVDAANTAGGPADRR